MPLDNPPSKLTRIGVFYDGGYYQVVSSYYRYTHPRKANISIAGIHRFLEGKVAEAEGVDARYCRVVDSHYFRGRYSIQSAIDRNKLESERRFEDILIRAGVTTHFLHRNQAEEEKGIDVWFALEAFELAVYKRFDVLVLIACDSDYLPLVRKVNTLGTRVMLLAWDFKYTDQFEHERETRTSQALIEEVTYPVMMHEEIDHRAKKNDPLVSGLFLAARPSESVAPGPIAPAEVRAGERSGTINNLKEGFGFVTDDADQVSYFFHCSAVLDDMFNSLATGQRITYNLAPSTEGRMQAVNVQVAH